MRRRRRRASWRSTWCWRTPAPTPRTLRSNARSQQRARSCRSSSACSATPATARVLILAQFAPLVRRGIDCAGLTTARPDRCPSPCGASGRRRARAKAPARESGELTRVVRPGRLQRRRPRRAARRARADGDVSNCGGSKKSQAIPYFSGETIDDPQPACDVIAKGDRVVSQRIDPFTLPALRSPPQRVAYEDVVAGDPATLALLKNKIVLVGTLLPGQDIVPLPWPAEDRWGVELFAVQIDAMAREFAIRQIGPVAEFSLICAMALLGAFTHASAARTPAHPARRRPAVDRRRVPDLRDRLVPIRAAGSSAYPMTCSRWRSAPGWQAGR